MANNALDYQRRLCAKRIIAVAYEDSMIELDESLVIHALKKDGDLMTALEVEQFICGDVDEPETKALVDRFPNLDRYITTFF